MRSGGLRLWGCALCRLGAAGGRRMCTTPSYSARPRAVWGALARERRPNKYCLFPVGTPATHHLDRRIWTPARYSSSPLPPMHCLSYVGRKEATSRYDFRTRVGDRAGWKNRRCREVCRERYSSTHSERWKAQTLRVSICSAARGGVARYRLGKTRVEGCSVLK